MYACATHGLFSGPAYERLENSCIEEVVVTNAVPVPLARQTGKIKVLSIAPLFAQTIDVVYNNGCYWETCSSSCLAVRPESRGGSPRSNSIEARIASRALGLSLLCTSMNCARAPSPGYSGLLFRI